MIEFLIAFGAGLISFLSPCVLPLIPGYISFITGNSLNELLESKKINIRPLILFTLGFSFVFIIFSLQLIGIININFLNFEKKIYTQKNNNIWFSFIIGMAFGFGWTPCIGPILGSILALASTEETVFKAIILLSFYSLGLAIPFILSGYLMQRFLMFSKNFKKNINLVTKSGGVILLITGFLILTNQLQILGYYILNYLPFLQNFG